MPTYRNDGTVSYKVCNYNDTIVRVKPGETVELLHDLGISDFTEIAANPTNKITVTEAPGVEGIFTDGIKPNADGYLNISITGYWPGGGIVLQKSIDGGVTWLLVQSFASSCETSIREIKKTTLFRLGLEYDDDENTVADPIILHIYK